MKRDAADATLEYDQTGLLMIDSNPSGSMKPLISPRFAPGLSIGVLTRLESESPRGLQVQFLLPACRSVL